MLRRSFLRATVACAAARVVRAAPMTDGQPLRLGIDAYSLRAFRWNATQLIDYAASLKLDALQVDMGNLESHDPDYLRRIRSQATERGLYLDAGAGSVCPTASSYNPKSGDAVAYLTDCIRTAHGFGATVIRCFMGSRPERQGPLPIEAHMEATIKVFRGVRRQAQDLGMKVALENHNGDLAAREVRTILEESGKDVFGSCLDTGNPMWLLEDPVETVEILGPYALTSHIRDSVLYEHPDGAAFQWVALGQGTMNWPAILDGFRRLCPAMPLQLEVITGRPPQLLPYLRPEFWKMFPNKPAEEFARFVALAKRGHPFEGYMMTSDGMPNPPQEYVAALKEQQRHDLEQSIAFAQHKLDLGVRWRS